LKKGQSLFLDQKDVPS